MMTCFLCGLVVVTAIRCLYCLVGMMLARIARDQCLVIDAKHFKIINENLSRFLTITQLTKLVTLQMNSNISLLAITINCFFRIDLQLSAQQIGQRN